MWSLTVNSLNYFGGNDIGQVSLWGIGLIADGTFG